MNTLTFKYNFNPTVFALFYRLQLLVLSFSLFPYTQAILSFSSNDLVLHNYKVAQL